MELTRPAKACWALERLERRWHVKVSKKECVELVVLNYREGFELSQSRHTAADVQGRGDRGVARRRRGAGRRMSVTTRCIIGRSHHDQFFRRRLAVRGARAEAR